jgi:DNA-binding PadR family transcriptional regulator
MAILTTTSYAILGLLSVKPWTSYDLAQQMDRSLGRMWPRATSKIYEEPKKLVVHGLAQAREESVGRRRRTVYSITAKGRRALAAWLEEPGEGPVLEFEQMLKVFFSDNGTKAGTLATLAMTRRWAEQRSAESALVGTGYLRGEGPFSDRLAQLELTSRFITDFYALVGEWAKWATEVVDRWPRDPAVAKADPANLRETVRRARQAAGSADTTDEDELSSA